MRELEKGIVIEFKDLSASLKFLVVLTWIMVSFYIISFIVGLIIGLTAEV